MNTAIFLLIVCVFSPKIALCADPCEVHSDDPWLSSVRANCVDSFGYPSQNKVWGEDGLDYQALDGKIKEMLGTEPYEKVVGLCDRFSHRPLKGKCQFKVRHRLAKKVDEVESSFAIHQALDGKSSVRDVVYESFMGIKNHGSPAQVCLRNPELEKRLEDVTGISYNGLCQEYLLAIRDRMIDG